MRIWLPIALLLAALPVSAQQAQPTAQVRALSDRILRELNDNVACSTANNELKDKLASAEAEVKRLKDKYEPKPEAKPETKP